MKSFFYIVIGLVIVAAGILFFSSGGETGKWDNFAKCLVEKEITMYGAAWCSHCQNEKNGFGSSFKYVPYVECPADPQKCIQMGVTGYPTWIFKDGKKLVGEQGLKKLSEESGCPLIEVTNR